jgi:OmpA family
MGFARSDGVLRVISRPHLGHPVGEPPPPFEIVGGFQFDRTGIRPGEQGKLIRTGRQIQAGSIRLVRLVGHTDPVGTPAYNVDLGRRRAIEVQRQLVATLERIRPSSSRPVQFTIESAGETRPVSTGTTEAERARNRRVEIFLPPASPLPTCRHDIRHAFAIEREAARRTLALSRQVANRFIQTIGAVGARGRFIPTVNDNKHWFAKLYEFTTFYEIGKASSFRHPAFVLHFIPIFYDLYYRALENWTAGHPALVSNLWHIHFTRAGRPDNSSTWAWINGVQDSIVTGTIAHVQGDMATALERAYHLYVAKYCLTLPPPFDEFRPDFFKMDAMVFKYSRAAFILHVSHFGPGFAIGSKPGGIELGQFLFGVGARMPGSLDISLVDQWRDTAWSEAKRRLGQ